MAKKCNARNFVYAHRCVLQGSEIDNIAFVMHCQKRIIKKTYKEIPIVVRKSYINLYKKSTGIIKVSFKGL